MLRASWHCGALKTRRSLGDATSGMVGFVVIFRLNKACDKCSYLWPCAPTCRLKSRIRLCRHNRCFGSSNWSNRLSRMVKRPPMQPRVSMRQGRADTRFCRLPGGCAGSELHCNVSSELNNSAFGEASAARLSSFGASAAKWSLPWQKLTRALLEDGSADQAELSSSSCA